jgi:hypothetical protein
VGTPENPDGYLAIQVGEFARRHGTIYLPWEMWNGLRPSSQEFIFYIEKYGRFRLEFDAPIGRLRV